MEWQPIETAHKDLSKCPRCGGDADNGHDRCDPPTAYLCSKCSELEDASCTPNDNVYHCGDPYCGDCPMVKE